jgi:hypothetical protein
MSKRSKNKRQHYVPRFLLRNFSANKRSIATLVLSSGKRIDEANLRHQCYADYFYGRDAMIEKAFSTEEDKIARLLRPLAREYLSGLDAKSIGRIREFVHFQRQRTLATTEKLNSVADAMLKRIASEEPSLADVDIDQYRIKLNSPSVHALYTAVTTIPLILDLGVKFLINSKTTGFVISDNPVVGYNQWAEHHPKFGRYRGTTGLALKGLQMFLPISADVCVALYDRSTYEYGNERDHVCTPDLRDVRLLNRLQAIHAFDCLYFAPDRISPDEITDLLSARARHPDLRTAQLHEGPVRTRPDGTLSQILLCKTPDPKIGAKFSFVRVTDRNSYADYQFAMVPARSPQLLKLAGECRRSLDEEVERENLKWQARAVRSS